MDDNTKWLSMKWAVRIVEKFKIYFENINASVGLSATEIP